MLQHLVVLRPLLAKQYRQNGFSVDAFTRRVYQTDRDQILRTEGSAILIASVKQFSVDDIGLQQHGSSPV